MLRRFQESAMDVWKALLSSFWALLLPVIILVGLRGGIFTPTEAGAVAAFYALFVSVLIYREMKFSSLYKVLIWDLQRQRVPLCS